MLREDPERTQKREEAPFANRALLEGSAAKTLPSATTYSYEG